MSSYEVKIPDKEGVVTQTPDDFLTITELLETLGSMSVERKGDE